MKKIVTTIYEATDGTQFINEYDCELYEEQLDREKNIPIWETEEYKKQREAYLMVNNCIKEQLCKIIEADKKYRVTDLTYQINEIMNARYTVQKIGALLRQLAYWDNKLERIEEKRIAYFIKIVE